MTGPEDTPDRVTRAFDEYVARFRTGQGDPNPILDRFEGQERRELEMLVEAFIATGPVSEPDPSDPAFNSMVERVLTQLDGQAGGLSVLLAELRAKARMTQEAVVSAISGSLDATPAETEKIDAYYHELEWGSLPAEGLNEKLYGLLARILGVKPEQLKDAADQLGPRYGAATGPVFARSVESIDLNDDASVAPGMDSPGSASRYESRTGPDRIDELFTGG